MRRMLFALATTLTTASAFAQVPVAEVVATLTPRHVGAACDTLNELGEPDEVLDALIQTANTVTMPPWVGTRAAHCVATQMQHSPKALAAGETWVSTPETAGFALIVLGELPHLSQVQTERLQTAVAPRLQADPTFAAHVRPLLRADLRSSDSSVSTP